MLLGEIWLKNAENLVFPNYKTYRNDRQTGPGGGTAILIKNSLKHQLTDLSNCDIEHTSDNIITKNGPIKVTAIYIRPRHDTTPEDLEALFDEAVPTIAMGNYNAKHQNWGCVTRNRRGSMLDHLVANSPHNLMLHAPNVPTQYGIGRPDILDILATRDINRLLQVDVLDDLSSDQKPILINYNCNPEVRDTKTIKSIAWKSYMDILEATPVTANFCAQTTQEIDVEVTSFTRDNTAATERATKRKPSTANKHTDSRNTYST